MRLRSWFCATSRMWGVPPCLSDWSASRKCCLSTLLPTSVEGKRSSCKPSLAGIIRLRLWPKYGPSCDPSCRQAHCHQSATLTQACAPDRCLEMWWQCGTWRGVQSELQHLDAVRACGHSCGTCHSRSSCQLHDAVLRDGASRSSPPTLLCASRLVRSSVDTPRILHKQNNTLGSRICSDLQNYGECKGMAPKPLCCRELKRCMV